MASLLLLQAGGSAPALDRLRWCHKPRHAAKTDGSSSRLQSTQQHMRAPHKNTKRSRNRKQIGLLLSVQATHGHSSADRYSYCAPPPRPARPPPAHATRRRRGGQAAAALAFSHTQRSHPLRDPCCGGGVRFPVLVPPVRRGFQNTARRAKRRPAPKSPMLPMPPPPAPSAASTAATFIVDSTASIAASWRLMT